MKSDRGQTRQQMHLWDRLSGNQSCAGSRLLSDYVKVQTHPDYLSTCYQGNIQGRKSNHCSSDMNAVENGGG